MGRYGRYNDYVIESPKYVHRWYHIRRAKLDNDYTSRVMGLDTSIRRNWADNSRKLYRPDDTNIHVDFYGLGINSDRLRTRTKNWNI